MGEVKSASSAVLLIAVATLAGCCPRGPDVGSEPPATAAPPTETPEVAEAATPRTVLKMTPLLTVETIEPCLDLWVDRLGFAKTMEVPAEDGALGFVGLARDGLELMLQTRASVEADVPAAAAHFRGASVLYLEVADLDWVIGQLGETEVLIPPRTTPYGMREVWVREPCGHVIGFAAEAAPREGSAKR